MARLFIFIGLAALLTLGLGAILKTGRQMINRAATTAPQETRMPKIVTKFAFIGLQILMFMAASGSLEGF